MDNHRILEIFDKESPAMGSLIDMEAFYKLEAKVQELDNKVNGIESNVRIISYQSYKILKASPPTRVRKNPQLL